MSTPNDTLSIMVGLREVSQVQSPEELTVNGSEKCEVVGIPSELINAPTSERCPIDGANIVYFDEENSDAGSASGITMTRAEREGQKQVHRELAKLKFVNPGGSIAQPQLSNVRRARRKINDDVERKSEKVYHDKKGKLVICGAEGVTLCDCLCVECPGCHWPCQNCGGRLCGPICQQNRSKFVTCVRVLGSSPENRTYNPYVTNKQEAR